MAASWFGKRCRCVRLLKWFKSWQPSFGKGEADPSKRFTGESEPCALSRKKSPSFLSFFRFLFRFFSPTRPSVWIVMAPASSLTATVALSSSSKKPTISSASSLSKTLLPFPSQMRSPSLSDVIVPLSRDCSAAQPREVPLDAGNSSSSGRRAIGVDADRRLAQLNVKGIDGSCVTKSHVDAPLVEIDNKGLLVVGSRMAENVFLSSSPSPSPSIAVPGVVRSKRDRSAILSPPTSSPARVTASDSSFGSSGASMAVPRLDSKRTKLQLASLPLPLPVSAVSAVAAAALARSSSIPNIPKTAAASPSMTAPTRARFGSSQGATLQSAFRSNSSPSLLSPTNQSPSDQLGKKSVRFGSEMAGDNGDEEEEEGMSEWSEDRITETIMSTIAKVQQGERYALLTLVEAIDQRPNASNRLSRQALTVWINVFAGVVSSLTPAFSRLVDAILALPWCSSRSDEEDLIVAYKHLLENLCSAHAFYVRPVLEMLVRSFRNVQKRAKSESQASLSIKFDHIHTALEGVLRLVPTASTLMVPIISTNFPHKTSDVQEQVWFFRNAMRICQYQPVLQDSVWSLAIDRLVQIDVEIQTALDDFTAEEFSAFEAACFDPDQEIVAEAEASGSFAVVGKGGVSDPLNESLNLEDDDGDDSDSDSSTASDDVEGKIEEMKLWIVKLDSVLHFMMSQTKKIATAAASVSATQAEMFFDCLVRVFERTILPTHKSRFSQFLLFYACSLSPACSERFLVLLARKTFDPTFSNITRIAATGYLASFVARAKFLDAASVRECLRMLNGWALRYVDAFENDGGLLQSVNADGFPSTDAIRQHETFYAAIQALMYIFCFRWRDIVNSESGAPQATNQLPVEMTGFQRIMMSKFSPLRICTRSIVNEFARLTHKLDLLYCYNYIRGTAQPSSSPKLQPEAESAEVPVNEQPAPEQDLPETHASYIDDFFPFDPCQLPMTSRLIKSVYTEWNTDDNDSEDDEDEDEVIGQSADTAGDSRMSNEEDDEDSSDEEDDIKTLTQLERGIGFRSRVSSSASLKHSTQLQDDGIDLISSSLEVMSTSSDF
ncbi:RNA polymerase I-specific transcription initiation factor RRN3-domain-containing protein [Zopfochytrium polystomum]|nr:RNA polymerase I-specific transcription initiation factor RRN3-domain-containing protein [Zopfochytrium polystomum]